MLVYGAGEAGEQVVRDMQATAPKLYRPIGFVDDDRSKLGRRIHGLPVLGTSDDLPRLIKEKNPSEVLVAIPRAGEATHRSVLRCLDRYDVLVKTLPRLHELRECAVGVHDIRDISLQDLLSRGRVGVDLVPTRRLLRGRRVLVTGAGGSIGSELCRQIVSCGSSLLVLVDQAENGLFDIANELADRGHHVGIHSLVGNVADPGRMNDLFSRYRPEIVFHAAAHKHVPLMEANMCEAVTNNVTGTRVVAETAEQFGVDRFVLLSTDKAVNPTSVMGVTKRVGELLLRTRSVGSDTTFVTVRFGNVLGSSGSVVPRFVRQIDRGGPVTVTHPDVRRFFMLIPEAVQLVLNSAALGEPGKLYVLKMGEQVKIVELARDLIRLAGFVPDRDIPISFIGLRPGEKLFEELVGADERTSPSPCEAIMEVEPAGRVDRVTLASRIAELERRARQNDAEAVVDCLGTVVPAFRQNRDVPAVPEEMADAIPTAGHRPTGAAVVPGCPGQICPACASDSVYRSPVKSEHPRTPGPVPTIRPHRCLTCGWRGWLTPVELFRRATTEQTRTVADANR